MKDSFDRVDKLLKIGQIIVVALSIGVFSVILIITSVAAGQHKLITFSSIKFLGAIKWCFLSMFLTMLLVNTFLLI